MQEDEARRRRGAMVQTQIADRGVRNPAVLAAMRRVPREEFLPESLRSIAYADRALPIEARQTVSQPYVVARMLEAAEVGVHDRVLEVGAGSGYSTAVLALLAGHVVALERHAELANLARSRLKRLGHRNVEVHCTDGSLGWPASAPFDAILVDAGGPQVPEALREQLAPGGRLVMPVGDSVDFQHLVKLTRRSATEFDREVLDAVAFVPLVGAQGWAEDLAR
ncbi:MAG TPA: protein-L-isoaspartate(D-aspartate) O-methyltransferase [Caldimonas sp.]|jgi:protein-L-isoaspartate(D-aspartate) O-methyltransferase|nr:protein-L-isoaspartate(D-aspartate) O-methyltransferase [Caldimonas sp.]HEX2543094.1 protein-L-isoaspartate(D-aspartate) O-methyltransferase [Caldimonas sp.]